jgi:hypothetical protein
MLVGEYFMKVKEDKKMSFGKHEETTVEATKAKVVIIHSNEVALPLQAQSSMTTFDGSPLFHFFMFGTNKLLAHNRPSRVPYTLT